MLTYGGTEVQDVTYNGNAVSSITYNGTEVWVAAKPNLADNSWATIKKVAQSGKAANYWNVGDTKDIAINGTFGGITVNGTYKAVIIGINHNASLEGTNKIHFAVLKDANGTQGSLGPVKMISDSNTTTAWEGCDMRISTLSAFKTALPNDLQQALTTVKKWTDNSGSTTTNNSSSVTELTETIFLPAEYEVHGSRKYANSEEQNKQSQYDYWKNGNSKIADLYTYIATVPKWWQRSIAKDAGSGYAQYCATERAQGLQYYYPVNSNGGFVPCFVI